MTVTLLDPAVRPLAPGFHVRRALPAAGLRGIGPFVFLDHFGPVRLERAESADVRPHPHIGLATVTWLLDGEIEHRDSLGTVQPIRPGDVNWMSAGRGIVHSERAPPRLRGGPAGLHGLQAWVALPRAREDDEPSFLHVPGPRVPVHESAGVRLAIVAGEAWGLRSPVPVASPLLYTVGTLAAGAAAMLPAGLPERAVYVIDGRLELDGTTVDAHRLAVVSPGAPGRLTALTQTRLAMLGGEPPDGPRIVRWNFVASTPERIEAARARWRDDRFPGVAGDAERIPLPD